MSCSSSTVVVVCSLFDSSSVVVGVVRLRPPPFDLNLWLICFCENTSYQGAPGHRALNGNLIGVNEITAAAAVFVCKKHGVREGWGEKSLFFSPYIGRGPLEGNGC